MSLALSCPFVQFEDLYDRLSKEELIKFLNENFESKSDVEEIREHAFGQGHAHGWTKAKLNDNKTSWQDSYNDFLKNL